MPRPRKLRSFFLVVVDEDKKVFNVVGPITDDRGWNKRIVDAQKQGRNVGCFTWPTIDSVQNILDSYSEQTGYRFSDMSVIDEPEDTTLECKG